MARRRSLGPIPAALSSIPLSAWLPILAHHPSRPACFLASPRWLIRTLGRRPGLWPLPCPRPRRAGREGGQSEGRQARLRSQSLDQEPGAQARAEEALVPPGPEMGRRMRAADQRRQAPKRRRPPPRAAGRRLMQATAPSENRVLERRIDRMTPGAVEAVDPGLSRRTSAVDDRLQGRKPHRLVLAPIVRLRPALQPTAR